MVAESSPRRRAAAAGGLAAPRPARWRLTRRRVLTTATAAAATGMLVLASCSVEEPPPAPVTSAPAPDARAPIRVNARPGGKSLLPADLTDDTTRAIGSLIYRGLVAYDAKGMPGPAVASAVTSTDDTVWTARLNPAARFSDGSAINAATFARSWAFTAARASARGVSTPLSYIRGYPGDGKSIPGVRAVDETTLRITLAAPMPSFGDLLGDPTTMPMAPSSLDDPQNAARRPLGNGPYLLSGEWTGAGSYTLRPNGVYTGSDKAVNAGLSFYTYARLDLAYEDLVAGKLDLIDELPPGRSQDVTGRSGLVVSRQPVGMAQSLDFPVHAPQWTGPRGTGRRLAISRAIDRAGSAQSAFNGARSAATDLSSPVVEGYSPDACGTACSADPAAALEAWQLAGPLDRIEIAYAADGSDLTAVHAVCADLTKVLSVPCTGREYDDPQALRAAVRSGEVTGPYLRTWRMRERSLAGFLMPRFSPGAFGNWNGYSSRLAQLQLHVAAQAPQASAAAAYGTAQRLILTTLPSVPLWTVNATTTSASTVSAVVTDAAGLPVYGQITRPRD